MIVMQGCRVIVGTPAVSDGFIIIRTLGHVYGVSGK